MIRENCTPRRGVVKDFLILSYGSNEYNFFHIIEDKLNQKFYITYGEYDFSLCSVYRTYYPGQYNYEIILGGKKLKIGDTVNIYVGNEIEPLRLENGKININNSYCDYLGTKNELPGSSIIALRFNQLVNEGDKNIFEEVNELILYEGFIERPNYD